MCRCQLSLLIIIILSGCASPDYISPTSGPTAIVRFATTHTSLTVLYQYKDQDCKFDEIEVARLRAGYLFKSNSKKIGIPLNNYHPNASHEIIVQANKTFYGVFSGEVLGLTENTCKMPFAFTPKTEDYEVLFVVNPDGCSVRVSQINSNSNGTYSKEAVSPESINVSSCTRFRIRAY